MFSCTCIQTEFNFRLENVWKWGWECSDSSLDSSLETLVSEREDVEDANLTNDEEAPMDELSIIPIVVDIDDTAETVT